MSDPDRQICVRAHTTDMLVTLPERGHILLILDLYYVNIQFSYPFTSWEAFRDNEESSLEWSHADLCDVDILI